MLRSPPRSTRTYTLLPDTTLFRSQPGREAPRGLEPLVQRDRLDLIIGRLGIGLGIDRLDRLLVLSILAAVTPLRFAFLDAPGVRQHVVEKITRLRRRIDRPPEALGDKIGRAHV